MRSSINGSMSTYSVQDGSIKGGVTTYSGLESGAQGEAQKMPGTLQQGTPDRPGGLYQGVTPTVRSESPDVIQL